jgi:predicted permease
MTIGERGQSPESIGGAYVSADAFGILGDRPVIGRSFLADDDRPGAAPVVMLGHRLWVSRYGGDPAVVGRSILVTGAPVTVIGVMPEGFEFPYREGAWQPLALMPGLDTGKRGDRALSVFGRVADGFTPAQARAEIGGIAAQLARDHPATNADIQPTAVRFGVQQVGYLTDTEPPLAMLATSVFVLLIACANVANLLLARSAGRAREMAIRASVGATRWRIVRQLLVESVLLAFPAGALGVWLSRFGVRFVSDAFGRQVPYWMRFSVDGQVLLVVVSLCLVASLLFGLAPALIVSKTDVSGVMKEGGRAGIAPRVGRWTSALVAAELALTLILLAGAGLMVRSFLVLYETDRAIDPSRILTVRLSLPDAKYHTPEQRTDFYQRLDDRLGTTPGLSLATVASARPFVGAERPQLSFAGGPSTYDGTLPSVSTVAIGPRYFEALGVRMVRGRPLERRDAAPGADGVVVNQAFADRHFPNADALGQRIRLTDKGAPGPLSPWLTIVGVSPTIRQSIASVADPVVYQPLQSYANAGAALIIGGRSDSSAITPVLRREVASLDPDVMLFNIRPLTELRADSRLQPRLIGTLLAAFAGIALVLSIVGLYGVTAYAVLQRTHEIGVRMALGARAQQVVWLFVRRAMRPVGMGLVMGLGGALAAGRLLRGLLIQTSSTDPATLVSIVTLMLIVAAAASVFPARRAARLDPLTVLRCE